MQNLFVNFTQKAAHAINIRSIIRSIILSKMLYTFSNVCVCGGGGGACVRVGVCVLGVTLQMRLFPHVNTTYTIFNIKLLYY